MLCEWLTYFFIGTFEGTSGWFEYLMLSFDSVYMFPSPPVKFNYLHFSRDNEYTPSALRLLATCIFALRERWQSDNIITQNVIYLDNGCRS